jgi:hypothetical protein
MRNRQTRERRCSYVVVAESAIASSGELRNFANYLSTLGLAGADVVVLDPSPRPRFDANARVLRWVGRHMPVRPEYLTQSGTVDLVRTAVTVAECEKVIVAAEDVRYTPEAVGQLCDLLDLHEVVEPQDYLDPLPWWGGIEAGRILIHRGIEPQPDHGATFGFRRTAIRSLRNLGAADIHDDQARRLASVGAEVYPASEVFVRRQPGALDEWLISRLRQAGEDFMLPMKSAFFFSLLPLLLLLATLGGLQLAGGYAGVIAFASLALAVRGRVGATSFFPMRAVLFAPLWVFERSVTVYWALIRRVRGLDVPAGIAMPEAQAPKARIASSSDS